MKLSKTTKIVGGIVLGLGALAAGYFFLIKPKTKAQVDENGNIITGEGEGQGGGTGQEEKKVEDEKLKAIFTTYKQTGKFSKPEDAEYFIKNLDYLNDTERPLTADIKTALKRSNMAYFEGKVTPRMSAADVDKFIQENAPLYDGKRIMNYKGGFDAPDLTPYTDYELKKLLANGWWFGLWYDGGGNYPYHTNGYAATSAGGRYVVTLYSLWGGSDGHIRPVYIPEQYKGEEYSYGFMGQNAVVIPVTHATLSNEIF